MFLKRSLLVTVLPLLLVGMLLAACGNNTNTAAAPPAATTAPAATPTAAPAPAVMTAPATVGGKSVTILTDAKGMTLYYYMPDSATTSACTGACATNWPPLLFTSSTTPTSSTTLPGILGLVSSTNGAQVQYQGHFLYTFVGDAKAGDTTGQGKNNVWFVATTDLTLLKDPNGGGYGGY
jgi:predicted lipoprotein with Yx(FWY)xxD motif